MSAKASEGSHLGTIKFRSLGIFWKVSAGGALASAALLYMDPRVLSGELLWLKPLKFFLSTVIFGFTLEWVFRHANSQLEKLQRYSWIIVGGLYFELLVIAAQAARGVKSHFNNQTSFDAGLFVLMGVVISAVVIVSCLAVFVATRAGSKLSLAEQMAARLGIFLLVAAAFVGNIMSMPTPNQMRIIQGGGTPPAIGSHFVGSEEGATRTLPVTGWSLDAGDLRVPHFFGMHILQALLIFSVMLGRTGMSLNSKRAVCLVILAGTALGLIWFGLLVQALKGQSVSQLFLRLPL